MGEDELNFFATLYRMKKVLNWKSTVLQSLHTEKCFFLILGDEGGHS